MISTQEERSKYLRMWTEVPDYRSNSPGERLLDTFLTRAKWQAGDTLVDLGCGTGRASVALHQAGLQVYLLDIVNESLDEKVKALNLPFIEACLWEHPSLFRFDWLYCCDVLEHIPTEHVDKVLDNMRAMTNRGAFLQIALWEDSYGNRIGETLHLTVKPVQWWKEKIEARWNLEWVEMSKDRRLIVLAGNPK